MNRQDAQTSLVLLDNVAELAYGAADILVFFAEFFHALFGVEDSGVVTVEGCAYLVGGFQSKLATEVHRDEAWNGNVVGASISEDVGDAYSEIL